jgi:hypothetical protein
MKYLCLVYADEKLLDEIDDGECMICGQNIAASGRMIAAEPLHPVNTATTLRVRNGKVAFTDGPFAETKEQLTGFYLVEAQNLDEALGIAAKIPPARVGSIEVRPVRQLVPKNS